MTEASPQQRASESLVTVIVALLANALIAVAKTVAAVLTGSASMVAEAAHSWADENYLINYVVLASAPPTRPCELSSSRTSSP